MIKTLLHNKFLGLWVVLAVAVTFSALGIYGATQQVLRQGANDPQIQFAEDIANELSNGVDPNKLSLQDKIEINKSLAVFLMIYNASGQLINSTAVLDGNASLVPLGVLQSAQKKGLNSVTWQPRSDVRSALVVVPFKGTISGFVAVGRSLRETEKRSMSILLFVGAAWLITIIGSLVIALFLPKFISMVRFVEKVEEEIADRETETP